ncbi:MAG: hypothetical protein AAFX50_24065, partial [Acidobacteriota bacterium]
PEPEPEDAKPRIPKRDAEFSVRGARSPRAPKGKKGRLVPENCGKPVAAAMPDRFMEFPK